MNGIIEKSDFVTILESNSSSIIHVKPTSVQIVHILNTFHMFVVSAVMCMTCA